MQLRARPLSPLFQDVLILTGGPGTGKIHHLKRDHHPIGAAGVWWLTPHLLLAKRMSEVTGREAKTIHRLLEVDFQDESGKNKFKATRRTPPLTQWWWMRCPWWTSSCLNR